MRAAELFDFPQSLPFASAFDPEAHPWEWLPQIARALDGFAFDDAEARRADVPAGVVIEGPVWFGEGVRFPPFAFIKGPAWIGDEVEIRPGAFIRGNVIVGRGSVLGNSCEYKNCLLMERVETPHFNYVGDSILGNRAHLGAGVICANLRLDRSQVVIRLNGKRHETGLRKVGAFVGDGAEAGCNSVLQPGTILGRRSAVISMPFQGFLPADTMALPETRVRTLPRQDA